MENTDNKEIIKEALYILKDKIAIAIEEQTDNDLEKDIDDLSTSIASMITKLEELAFDAGRLTEDDNTFAFKDFDDFQNG